MESSKEDPTQPITTKTNYASDYEVLSIIINSYVNQDDSEVITLWEGPCDMTIIKDHSMMKEDDTPESQQESRSILFTSSKIKNRFPIGYVKIVRLDRDIEEFKNNDLRPILNFISEHNRRALEWQIIFVASPTNESGVKHFRKNYEKIKKNCFSFEQAHRFSRVFFFNETSFKATSKLLKAQRLLVDEIQNNMKILVNKGVDKKVSTLANEISYTQAKTIGSKKQLIRFINVNENLANLYFDLDQTELGLTLYQNLGDLLNSQNSISSD
ncbi:unnamed protein product [Moneuplotes crassus]|uniref:Uncharacterized protein n=1 Tax=Euplotes crassus TaxID=5936 RepID=A0AAD2DAE0_EUPCR|nr:unnamed protein product [Moneuplotes crassus]